MSTQITYTLIGLGVCIVLGLLSYRMHTREHNKLKPRLVPWSFIAMACIATGFMLFVHLINLFGLETGQGRR